SRRGPPPTAASIMGIDARIRFEKPLPHTKRPPALARASSPRARTDEPASLRANSDPMPDARYQPQPAAADVRMNVAPVAKLAPTMNRHRNEPRRLRAAESMVGSLNFSPQQDPRTLLTGTLLSFGLTDRLYYALQAPNSEPGARMTAGAAPS